MSIQDVKDSYCGVFTIPYYLFSGMFEMFRQFLIAMLMDAEDYVKLNDIKLEEEREALIESALVDESLEIGEQ